MVKPTVEPQTINWQNFGVAESDQRNKNFVLYLLLLILIFLCVQAVILYEEQVDALVDVVPNLACPAKDVSAQEAYLDLKALTSKKTGAFHCFCSKLFSDIGSAATAAYSFEVGA